MSYGTIKADQITHAGAGGSDVATTIASLVAPKEGTAIISTGESGTTKFLRVDGDGTCSWQVPPDTNTQLTLIDEDDMASNDATKPPSQQSVKAYVDTKAPTANPTFTGTVNAAALTLSGNLTVGGTTTTVNSSTLEVADKNIELGKVSTPTDTTADGGGITLKGATDKTFQWTNSIDAWSSSEHIKLSDNKKLYVGASEDLQIYHDGSHSYIKEAGTGALKLDGDDIRLTNAAGNNIVKVNGTVAELFHTGNKKLETTADGVTVTGTVSDTKGDVRKIPLNLQSSAYTLVAADASKHIRTSANVTIPNSVFTAGDAVTIINQHSGDITLTQGSGVTLWNAANGTSGNRTLATRGMATLIWTTASIAYISGAGLS
mgnify:CR=1 FL=1